MKKILIFCFVLSFLSQFSISQTVVDDGMSWSVWHGYYGPLETSWRTRLLKIEGDTTFNDMDYKIIKTALDTTGQNYEIQGALRMDSSKKVYYSGDFYEERLLYDFNLQPEDTFTTTGILGFDYEYDLVVDAVDSVLIDNGTYTKRITFIDYNTGYPVEQWYEAFGSNFGLLYSGFYRYTWDQDYELLCSKQNDDLLYMNSNYNTCFLPYVNVSDQIKPEVRVYPNPCKSKLTVNADAMQKLELYDSKGMILLAKDVEKKQYKLDLQNIQPGMYLLKIITADGALVSKVIKE
ncbi:MAG: T9SS type A sorting domain-containing protein [Bacteroidota bacterium]